MLALVPESVALKAADLFTTPGELCAVLQVDEDVKNTSFSFRGMNYWEAWVISEEIALACRLRRLAGWKDEREEIDTLGTDKDSKVCVTYQAHRQDFGWMRKNISYQDAELMMMTVSEVCKRQLFPEGSIK